VSLREVSPAFLATISSRDPSIAADPHGRVALSFVTSDSSGANLWLSFSRDSGATFTEPVRVNDDPGRVQSSPAGRPVVALGPGASVAVAWMESGGSASTPRFMVRTSRDGGLSLAPPAQIAAAARARRSMSGGTIAFLDDGSLFATWIEGPQRASPEADTVAARAALTERSAPEPGTVAVLQGASSPDGGRQWPRRTLLADSVCACAPALRASGGGRVAVAFQRVSRTQRAPAVQVSRDGGRTFALDTLGATQRERLDTCPRQGLALEWTHAEGGLLAWVSGAGARHVQVAPWSTTALAPMARPVTEGLAVARHPRLSQLGGATLIATEARRPEARGRTVIAVRLLDHDGTLSSWCFLGADAEAGWIAGLSPRTGIACWTEREGEALRARVVMLHRRFADSRGRRRGRDS